MRVQISPALMRLMRQPENWQLREMIESLRTDPFPGWTRSVSGEPALREFYYLEQIVVYQVDDSSGERILYIALA